MDAKQKKLLKLAARKLGARVAKKLSPQVTHVITNVDENRIARRTIKYASGIVCGCWIIGFECKPLI